MSEVFSYTVTRDAPWVDPVEVAAGLGGGDGALALLSDGGPAHQHIVSQLIDAGADLNLPDKQGVTPLHHAQQRGQRVIAQLLRAAGAH